MLSDAGRHHGRRRVRHASHSRVAGRTFCAHTLGTLSRRFGATLLRRVATRLEEDAAQPGAPGLARSVAERAAAAERSIADLLEPEPVARK